ncbi:MAG: hypothetical protein K2N28_04590 [Muribaculaceae bacterium]|nr:hypothetical protein [Muribaculaceae bacterium]
MKNCTIPSTFFTDILSLSPDTQIYVLTTCQQLIGSDDDAIERYQLPADAPALLVDFVKRLKRRVLNSKKRRARRAATPSQSPKATDKQSAPIPITEDKRADAVMEMYELAVDLVVTSGHVLSRADRARIRQLAKALMKHMDNIAATNGMPPSRYGRA